MAKKRNEYPDNPSLLARIAAITKAISSAGHAVRHLSEVALARMPDDKLKAAMQEMVDDAMDDLANARRAISGDDNADQD